MGGWAGLIAALAALRHDHPLYFHSALIARRFFALSGTNAGYDPSFMAGYAKSVIFPASSTLARAGRRAVRRRRTRVLAYKLYVLVAAALIPWLVAGRARLWRAAGRGDRRRGRCSFLVYVWTDFPINYVAFGMVPYFLAVPLGLVATGP